MKPQPNFIAKNLAAVLLRSCFIPGLAVFVATAAAAPRQPPIPMPEALQPLWHESFDQYYTFRSTNALLSLTNGCELINSWSGYALLSLSADSPITPYAVPAVNTRGHTNISCTAGAIRFWLTPYWPATGPGATARLLTLYTTTASQPAELWSLQVSSDGSSLSFLAQAGSDPVQLLQLPITWAAQSPHCVLLNYGPQGTSLFLDGQFSAQTAATLPHPTSPAQLVIGSSLAGTEIAQAAFDEVYSFRLPLTASELTFYYGGTIDNANLGPISDAEMAAILQVRAARLARKQAAALALQTARAVSRVSSVPSTARTSMHATFASSVPALDITGLPLVTNVPIIGTFWSRERPGYPPTPCDPFPDCDVYAQDDGSYVIDDTLIDYDALDQPTYFPRMDESLYPTNSLWIEPYSLSSSYFDVILHGHKPGLKLRPAQRDRPTLDKSGMDHRAAAYRGSRHEPDFGANLRDRAFTTVYLGTLRNGRG